MFKCPAIVCASSCAEFDGDSGFSHVWRGGSHWFHPRNCWHKKVPVLEISKTAKNGEKSALFTIYFYQIHHFWYVFGHVIKQFLCPWIWYPLHVFLTYRHVFLSLISLVIFSPLIRNFSPLGQLLEARQTPWKWFLKVPWWNAFHLGPRKAPEPLVAKKNFEPLNHKKV